MHLFTCPKLALAAIVLIAGNQLTAAAQTTPAPAFLNCQPGASVFTACFYSGTAFNTFLLQRQDPRINFMWGLSGPYAGGPIFQFSARWQGNFNFSAGRNRFTVTANQGARLYIDGKLVLNDWSTQPGASTDVVQTLTAGQHLITLEYFNGWDFASAQLSWQQDAGFREFYVSPSGSDQNDGRTPATAWQTALKVDWASFQPGDHILFAGGQTFAGPIYFGADDVGTAAEPITVTSYGSGRATIKAGTSVGLLAYNTAGIEIGNMTFVGSPGNSADGVQFYQTLPGNVKLSHIRIDKRRDQRLWFVGYQHLRGRWNEWLWTTFESPTSPLMTTSGRAFGWAVSTPVLPATRSATSTSASARPTTFRVSPIF